MKTTEDTENESMVMGSAPAGDARPSIFGESMAQLEALMTEWGQPKFRARQVMDWVYRKRVSSWDELTNIPATVRQRLAERFVWSSLHPVREQGARDTTRKFLFQLRDRRFIESVVIPANPALYGETSDRHTLCVSTQVGCAMACGFCASGLNGLTRNLTVAEMVEQIVAAERLSGERMDNLVFMGMGEPLANYRRLMAALTILNAPWGVGIGARHITLSTSGLVPGIRQLASEPLPVRLAISLHGATDAVRDQIMPVNRKYPLAMLLPALSDYTKSKKQIITLEFILIAGVNDTSDQAERLSQIARRLRAKVNLIPYNTVEGLPWSRPSEAVQDQFAAIVRGHGVTATLRREKGHDIEAACGQLRLQHESDQSAATGETEVV